MTPQPSQLGTPIEAAQALRSTSAIRERAHHLLERARRGDSEHFAVSDAALANTARLVAEVTLQRYPDLRIPYHSRWRHFEAGQVNRLAMLDDALGPVDEATRARAHVDLALVSVLLDAGAGATWTYHEATSGQDFTRSEGLGVASFHAFMGGVFSSDPAQALQADAQGLRAITSATLAQAFQVGDGNPLTGLDGRVTLLRRLGDVMAQQAATFGPKGSPCRPGGLWDALTQPSSEAHPPLTERLAETLTEIHAHDILTTLLRTLADIWPAQNAIDAIDAINSVALGDCWQHPAVLGDGLTHGWMPFHKLSQWLTYSLLEPFEWSGVKVVGLDALTGLPEYRNGGLLIDSGALKPLVQEHASRVWQVGDPFIVEWRALTVALLDELAPMVRTELSLSPEHMPLACVLEGGTWAAGRVLAQRLRGGLPPLNIASDGTVF